MLAVEVATPLTEVVRVLTALPSVVWVMTGVVALTPLTVLVKVFPVTDCVNELTRLANDELMPFTMTLKRFAEEEAVADVMIELVAETPLVEFVRTLPRLESALVVLLARSAPKLPIVALVIVVVARVADEVAVSVPIVVLYAVRFTKAARAENKLVMVPVVADRIELKKLLDVALVRILLLAARLVVVALLASRLTV